MKYSYNPITTSVQYYHYCKHNKSLGILKLQKKLLLFESFDSNRRTEINIDHIVNVEEGYNEKNNGELIKITTVETYFIFNFFDLTQSDFDYIATLQSHSIPPSNSINSVNFLNKTQARNKLIDLLKTRNNIENNSLFKDVFKKKLLLFERIEINQILDIDEIFSLYKELSSSNILRSDEFWKFIRKKYNSLYCSSFSTIQFNNLSRADEMFLRSPDNINFNLKMKNKILNSSRELYILYNESIKFKEEKDFWKEFLTQQINQQTRLSGGFSNIFFTDEQMNIIKSSWKKHLFNKLSNNTIGISGIGGINYIPLLFNPITTSISNLTIMSNSQGGNYWNFEKTKLDKGNRSIINRQIKRIIDNSSINIFRLCNIKHHMLWRNDNKGSYNYINNKKSEYDYKDIELKSEFNIEDQDSFQIEKLIKEVNQYSINKLDRHYTVPRLSLYRSRIRSRE